MTVEINSLVRPSASTRFQDLRALLVRHVDVVWIVALALVAAAYSLQYDILRQPLPHDTTFHIYAAQQILDGHAIYRDVAIIKAPLADFASAFAILIARAVHISDIMGTRLMSLAVVMATTGATYLAGRVLFGSRTVGVFAGLIMAGWNFYGLRAVTGPEPKAFLILFSLLALVCIAQKRWGWAGACAALSTLAWQPALMVAAIGMAAAALAPWLEPKHQEKPDGSRNASSTGIGGLETRQVFLAAALRNNARFLLGFAAPFAIVIFYLVVNQALAAAFNATIGANVTHFNNNQARVPLFQTVDENLAEIISEGALYCFSPTEYWLVGLGAIGFAGIAVTEGIYALRQKRAPLSLARTPLLLYGLGFAAFALIDFDFCPDLFPLLPVLALATGWLAWTLTRHFTRLVARFSTPVQGERAHAATLTFIAILIVALFLLDAWGYRIPGSTFLDQLAVAQRAKTYLQPGDRVLAFGNTIVPIELHMQNASKILHLGSKSGLGVLVSEPGGLQGMIDALDRDPPRLISLARENRPDWTKPFYEWLERRYTQVDNFPRANIRLLLLKP